MIRINLLPENKRPSFWPACEYILLAAAGAVLLMITAALSFNYFQLVELSERAAQLQQQQELLKDTVGHMEKAGEKQLKIKNKTDLLLTLTDERSSWHAFLCHISEITPARVWLTEAVIKNKEGVLSANIKGRALTYDDIAIFLQKLEQDEYLRSAILIKAEKVDSFGGGQFEIAAQIKKL